jgi:hypothetical protein
MDGGVAVVRTGRGRSMITEREPEGAVCAAPGAETAINAGRARLPVPNR